MGVVPLQKQPAYRPRHCCSIFSKYRIYRIPSWSAQCYIALCCSTLHCPELQGAEIHCTTLHWTVLYCAVLHFIALHSTSLLLMIISQPNSASDWTFQCNALYSSTQHWYCLQLYIWLPAPIQKEHKRKLFPFHLILSILLDISVIAPSIHHRRK